MQKDFRKDFDKWNKEKKKLDATAPTIFCHKREIWWCALGLNVGFEQHSMSEDFSRPVVVIRRFTDDMFWGVPLTTKINDDVPFRVRITVDGVQNDAMILQMRSYDRKRLRRKLGVVPKLEFSRIINLIKSVI